VAQDVAPTVLAMADEMGPDELTARAVARHMGLQDPQIWRALPQGLADILFLVAADLQLRQATVVRRHDGLRKRSARHASKQLTRMLNFDFEPKVKAWRRACLAQGWYWTSMRRSRVMLRGARTDRQGPWHRRRLRLGSLRGHVQGRVCNGLDPRRDDDGARRSPSSHQSRLTPSGHGIYPVPGFDTPSTGTPSCADQLPLRTLTAWHVEAARLLGRRSLSGSEHDRDRATS
jgi:hypothetical protein